MRSLSFERLFLLKIDKDKRLKEAKHEKIIHFRVRYRRTS